jgi:hypothetical protein
MVVVVVRVLVCLLMTPKSSVGKRRHSIWTSLGTLQIPWNPFRRNSVEANSCIPSEFEFRSKFRQNLFINLAGAWAKINSSGIPGIARIPPDSVRNQWGTVKTSLEGEKMMSQQGLCSLSGNFNWPLIPWESDEFRPLFKKLLSNCRYTNFL